MSLTPTTHFRKEPGEVFIISCIHDFVLSEKCQFDLYIDRKEVFISLYHDNLK